MKKYFNKISLVILVVVVSYFVCVGSIIVRHNHMTKCHATYVVDGETHFRKSLHK